MIQGADPPWARRPESGGQREDEGSAPWAEPPELVALRGALRATQDRVDRASRKLELAAQLRARLEPLVETPLATTVLPAPSPERAAAEAEATGIILHAELEAARILNATGQGGTDGNELRGLDHGSISPGTASAAELYLGRLSDIETGLVELGRRLRPDN